MPSFIVSLMISGLLLAGQQSPRLAELALAGEPPTIYRLVAGEAGRCAIVAYGQDPSGEAVARWELNIGGRALAVTRDAGRACVIGVKPQTGRHRGDAGSHQWTLMVVDLITGRATEPMSLTVVPSAMTVLAPPGSEPKLLIAASDRIAAYSLDPPGTSWYYKSPGENRAIAAGGASLVATLRGGTLAIIDPARRPRIEGRLQLTDDDVTSTIDLGTAGLAVAMSDDGLVAAVLHEDRLTVSLVDVAAGKVFGTRRLSEQQDSPVLRILPGPRSGYRLIVASVSPLPSMTVVEFDAPPPVVTPPSRTQTAPPPPPPAVPAVAAPETPQQATPAVQIPPTPSAESIVSPVKEPVLQPQQTPTQKPDSEQVPEPIPPPVPTPEPVAVKPPEPPRSSDEETLTGTISGDSTAAKEVRFYGPNNILKLHARATVGPDGSFRVTIPPAGSYRVVVAGDPGAHLFTHPEFRVVVVGADGKGISGIDFEVRGRL